MTVIYRSHGLNPVAPLPVNHAANSKTCCSRKASIITLSLGIVVAVAAIVAAIAMTALLVMSLALQIWLPISFVPLFLIGSSMVFVGGSELHTNNKELELKNAAALKISMNREIALEFEKQGYEVRLPNVPTEIWSKITKLLPYKDLLFFSGVCKDARVLASSVIRKPIEAFVREHAFGKEKWKEKFQKANYNNEIDDEEPPIPNIFQMFGHYPKWRNFFEKHRLVLIPSKLDGKIITINLINDLFKFGSQDNPQPIFTFSTDKIREQYGSSFTDKSHWVCTEKFMVGAGISYNDLEKIPNLYDMAMVFFATIEESQFEEKVIRCQEKINEVSHVVLRCGFKEKKFEIDFENDLITDPNIGTVSTHIF